MNELKEQEKYLYIAVEHELQTTLAQCSISKFPENVRKPKVFRGIEMEHWIKMG